MLKAKKLSTSPAGGFSTLATYYDPSADRSPEQAMDEYYQADRQDRIPAQWWCPAGLLVQDGAKLEPSELKQALEGIDANGMAMVKSQPNRIGGFDLTLSAPKPVSVAYALADNAGRQQISEDMLSAVRQTFSELHTAGAFVTRRGAGGKIHEPARDVKIAIVAHFTSRAADPQIHFHCVLANSALRLDGKTGAIHSRAFYNANKDSAISRRFLGHLSERLEAHGMQTQNHTRTGFDIAGIPQDLVAELSKRRQTILAEQALNSPAVTPQGLGQQRQRIARQTRAPKATVPTRGLDARWQAEAAGLGYSASGVWQAVREARDSLAARAQRLKQAMGETLRLVQDKGSVIAQAVGQRLRLVQQARSMLPELQPDMARAAALYGRKVREGMPLADAVARFTDYDARNGQPARTGEWQQRLSAAAKAPAQAIEVQPVRRMEPKLRMTR